MIFLESPDLGDSKETWVNWLAQLRQMNRRDSSVVFAIKRAERIIQEMEKIESNQFETEYA